MPRSLPINIFKQDGLTMLEMAVVMVVLGLIAVPMSLVIFQTITIPIRASGTNNLIHDVRLAPVEIAEDARNATTFTPGSGLDYGTFAWVDRTGSSTADHSVRYFYSTGDETLKREEIIDAGTPTTLRVIGNVKNQGDVSIQQTGDLITASVTATISSGAEDTTRSATIRTQLRPGSPTAQPTPSPVTLARDDFESGDFTGGTGWAGDWATVGNTNVVGTEAPFEGSEHMRLRNSAARAEREIDLLGQSDMRIQFQYKAQDFSPGDTLVLEVSVDGGGIFTPIRTWVDGEDDDTYTFEDVSLRTADLAVDTFIAFDSNMSGDFFVDDLKIVRSWSGQ